MELVLQEKIKKIRQLRVWLRGKEKEISSLKGSLKDSKEREEKLNKEAKQLKRELNDKTQEAKKLAEEKKELFRQLQEEELSRDEIKSLKRYLHQKEKKVSKLQDDKSKLESSKKDLYNECEKLMEHNSALKSKVQHLQETVNQSEMQNESSHSAPLDISSEHLSEFEGISENEFTNGQFSKPKPPYTSTPRTKKTSTKKSLNLSESPILGNNSPNLQGKKKSPSKSPEKMGKENSGQSRSPHTSTGSPNLSPLKDRTSNSYHTLTM